MKLLKNRRGECTIEEAVEVSVVMTCTTHHETIEEAVEVSVEMDVEF